MIEFIKRNKFFSSCIAICLLIIATLIGLVLFENITGKENILVIPPLIDDEKKEPEISLFSGEFDDEDDEIVLTWDYQMNGYTFQKVELYRNDELIKLLYNERSYRISIYDFDICTGDNEFEIRLYYDDGIIVSKKTNVFVDYVFNIQFSYQMIDNNLGKGYLLKFKYDYNVLTPAGLPKTTITTNEGTASYWKWEQLSYKLNPLKNGYQEFEVYYLLKFDTIPDQEITWFIDFRLDSVGVRYEDTFTENPSTAEIITQEIKIK